MRAELRPMTLGEILDRTVQIYRTRLLLFLGITCLPFVAAGLLWLAAALLNELFASAPNFPLLLRTLHDQIQPWLPAMWLFEYANYLVWPPAAYLASRVLFNEKPTLLSAIWWCVARWRSWLGLATIYFVAFQWLPFAVRKSVLNHYWLQYQTESALGFRGGWPAPRTMMLLLTSVTLAFAAWFNIALNESAPAWAMERLKLREALKRGWTIGIGGWEKVLVAWITVSVLSLILTRSLGFLLYLSFNFIRGPIRGGDWIVTMAYSLLPIATRVAELLVMPLLPIAATLIYYDQRVRQEGFDIELMMTKAGMDMAKTTGETV